MGPLVIGDAMVDRYLLGHIDRFVEGGVKCIKNPEEVFVPGGAANVARNLADLGQSSVLLCFGNRKEDPSTKFLEEFFSQNKGTHLLVYGPPGYKMAVKTRIYAGPDYVVRFDTDPECIPEYTYNGNNYYTSVGDLCNFRKCIVISDYNKGAVNSTVISIAVDSGSRVIGNLKPATIKSGIAGMFLVSMNEKEFRQTGAPENACEAWGVEYVVVTRGDKGLVVYSKSNRVTIPAKPVRVKSTVGAGDAIISSIAVDVADGNLDITNSVMDGAVAFASKKIGTERWLVNGI